MKISKNEGTVFAILSSVFSSLATVIASIGTKAITPLLFLSVSGLVGSLFLLVMLKFYKQNITLEKIKKNAKDIANVTIFRSIIGSVLLMVGLSISTGIQAIFFTKMEPYFILIYNWIFLHEKISRKHIGLIFVHLFGVFLLATGGILAVHGGLLGDMLIILAVAVFAHTYISGRRLSNEIGPISANLITYGIAAVVVIPVAIAVILVQKPALNFTGFEYILPYALFFNVLTLTLWFAALKELKGWLVSALRAVGPVIAAPFAFIFFGQILSYVQIIGGILILATSFILAYDSREKR